VIKNIIIEGFGNCENCKYDQNNNKKCKGYQSAEIKFTKIDIEV